MANIRDKSASLNVKGLKELNAAFKAMDRDMPKAMRKEFKALATIIRNRAAAKVPGGFGSVLKVSAGQSGAGIGFPAGGTWSGKHNPRDFYPWLDFGGSVGPGHKKGNYWSGRIKRDWKGVPNGSGRYLYPTIAESGDEIREMVDDAIRTVAASADFDTTGSLD